MQLAQHTATLKTRGGYQISTPGGADEVVIQLNNFEVMRITLGANMTIKTQGNLSIEATNITLKAGNTLTVESGAKLDLKAVGASVALGGGKVSLNNGALEVT